MKMTTGETTLWKWLFALVLAAYCLYYSPYGVNETDGGFITGLAWQLLCGKALYIDVVYVRPPLPVWLRSLELLMLPENWAILGERWIFYGKVALYSWLAAATLYEGRRRWLLATFGFVVSAHCYPAMAWHTTDGILFAVLSAYFLFRRPDFAFWGGVALCGALLCKQSFYPLAPLAGVLLFFQNRQVAWRFLAGLSVAAGLFLVYLAANGIIGVYFSMTSQATGGAQAIQHGLVDYVKITPELALPSLILLALAGLFFRRGRTAFAGQLWDLWLPALPLSFAAVTWLRQEHTAPFAQSRALFWVAAGWIAWRLWQNRAFPTSKGEFAPLYLLAVCWTAAISWGYNLPLLFSTPWIWAVMEISSRLRPQGYPIWKRLLLLAVLLGVFRLGYEFVYRDGKRSEMQVTLGEIFPALTGIRSDRQTAEQYRELAEFSRRFGPDFTVLPAFPAANFLTRTCPPLPMDWVVRRENNGDDHLLNKAMENARPYLLFEKKYLDKWSSDPELAFTRKWFERLPTLAEGRYFIVKKP